MATKVSAGIKALVVTPVTAVIVVTPGILVIVAIPVIVDTLV